jgi:hypothetical protein
VFEHASKGHSITLTGLADGTVMNYLLLLPSLPAKASQRFVIVEPDVGRLGLLLRLYDWRRGLASSSFIWCLGGGGDS